MTIFGGFYKTVTMNRFVRSHLCQRNRGTPADWTKTRLRGRRVGGVLQRLVRLRSSQVAMVHFCRIEQRHSTLGRRTITPSFSVREGDWNSDACECRVGGPSYSADDRSSNGL